MKSELIAAKSDVKEEVAVKIKDYILEALQIADSTKSLGLKLRVAITGYSIACKIPALHEYKASTRSILQGTYSKLQSQNSTNSSNDMHQALELLNTEDIH
jgi:hypothetical protein